jgi:L-ascorbate metabolism protein UlaG (beta-lactamase superfamily)
MDISELQRKLADHINGTEPDAGSICFWWLGQSGFVFKTNAVCIAVDPYLSTTLEDATRNQPWKQHVRMMPIPVAPEMLTCLDYVLLTHDHRDHYDPVTVSRLAEVNLNLTVVAPRSMEDHLREEKYCRLQLMDDQVCFDDAGTFTVSAYKAKHNEFAYTAEKGYPYLSYCVAMEGIRIFIAGDTIMYEGFPQLLESLHPDAAFLPINGFTAELQQKGFASNLTYQQAAQVCQCAGIPMLVPCHYDMFTINTEQIGRFVNYVNGHDFSFSYTIPTIGDTFILQKGGTVRWR